MNSPTESVGSSIVRTTSISLFHRRSPDHALGSLYNTHLERLCAMPNEPDEPLSLLGKNAAILFGQRLERLDDERSLPAGSLRLPRPLHEAVDKEGGRNHAVPGGDRLAVLIDDDAGAFGVGEDHFVKLGQETRRGRGFRVGPRGVGQVEQIPAVLVAKGKQARPQPLDYLAEPGQARPGLHVLDARRSERPQIA